MIAEIATFFSKSQNYSVLNESLIRNMSIPRMGRSYQSFKIFK